MFSKSRFLTTFFSFLFALETFSLVAFYYPPTASLLAFNLSHENLGGSNLAHTNLRWVNLTGTVLDGADLRGADLRNTVGLTKEQLASARVDEHTNLPDYLLQTGNPAEPSAPFLPRDPSWSQRTTSTEIIIDLSTDVLFDFGEATIRSDAKPTLQELALLIEKAGDVDIQLNGHTDSIASERYNLELSEQRATSVKQWLVENGGIDAVRLRIAGYGEKQPIAKNENEDGSDNPEGRQKNRRVEIRIPRKF